MLDKLSFIWAPRTQGVPGSLMGNITVIASVLPVPMNNGGDEDTPLHLQMVHLLLYQHQRQHPTKNLQWH